MDSGTEYRFLERAASVLYSSVIFLAFKDLLKGHIQFNTNRVYLKMCISVKKCTVFSF